MKKQNTFSNLEFKGKKKETKKEIFLNAMESLIPWNEWLSVVEKVYPKAGNDRRTYRNGSYAKNVLSANLV